MSLKKILEFGISNPFHNFYFFVPTILTFSALSIHSSLGVFTCVTLFFAGILSWTFVEYVLHRFVFHIKSRNPQVRNMCGGSHLSHHKKPNLTDYVGSPLALGLPVFMSLFAVFHWVFSSWFMAMAFMAGMASAYLVYEWVHYSVHQNPKIKLMDELRKHHYKHHFSNPQKAFGVTTSFWDRVFRTMPEETTSSQIS